SRRRHTRFSRDWSSDVCSSDLFDPALKPDAPYQSWGTEYVFVSEDRGDFIALQHVLVMRMQDRDGRISEPLVTRHWRQEWRYEQIGRASCREREQRSGTARGRE